MCLFGITPISLCQDRSGLVHPLTLDHLTRQLANDLPYHTALLIKLLCKSSEGWCLDPSDLPLAPVETGGSLQERSRCLGLELCGAWCSLAPRCDSYLAVTKKPHSLELNTTALEGMRRGRYLKPAPCLAASCVGAQGKEGTRNTSFCPQSGGI